MEDALVKRQPKPRAPTRKIFADVDKALLDEYEKVFKQKVWIVKERTMLVEQYMRDRLASYKKNHPKG